MPNVTAAVVELDGYTVIDVKLVNGSAPPADTAGFRYLVEGRDYDPAHSVPHLGDEWNGALGAANCRFAPPAPPEPGILPDNVPDAIDALQAQATELQAKIDQLRAVAIGDNG